ncbi:MAG: ATP-binding protein, partial [Nitrospirae bacterium]|nr:ATP-binding protein [Nitrospirota bacterium]
MGENINFLTPDLKQIRHSIKDIDDSYNHEWDILAELCQNAVDAIRKSKIEDGIINLRIDAINNSIFISDNGIGIDPDELPILLKPFATNKRDDNDAVGEKGVGLTFVLFSCNDFRIKSGNNNGSSTGLIKDARIWKERTDDAPLHLDFQESSESFYGTEITLNKISDCPIFMLNFNQLKYTLRTKTAIGSTRFIWDND